MPAQPSAYPLGTTRLGQASLSPLTEAEEDEELEADEFLAVQLQRVKL